MCTYSFHRHGIKCLELTGERGAVDPEVTEDWKTRLPTICQGYALKDIFNADETGVYYRALPTRGLVQKGEDAAGLKKNMNRVTALVACSAAGEKLKPFIIGKSKNPRAFQVSR